MASRKRNRDADIVVQVAEGEPLPADSLHIRIFSSVAKELPADAQTWDVSGLKYNEEPFSRQCVSCWLNCSYSMLYGPAELDADDTVSLSTAGGLLEILRFCQAVGSPNGVATAACSQVEQLKFCVPQPEPEEAIILPLNAGAFYGADIYLDGVRELVVAQTAELLLLAHLLRVQPLLDAVHSFVFSATLTRSSVLYGQLGEVFTDAVLDAALGNSTLSKDVYLSSVLSRPASFAQGAVGHEGWFNLVGPVTLTQINNPPHVMCRIELLRDLAEFKAGETADAQLCLFTRPGEGSFITLQRGPRHAVVPFQLLLGHCVTPTADIGSMMSSAADDN